MGKRPSAYRYLKELLTPLPSVSSFKVDLTGKTVIVIGANVGLGLETARHFAASSPDKLILGCRSMERAAVAADDIKKTTGCTTIECWEVDLSDFKSVVAFAKKFKEDSGDGALDLLVMNAGVYRFKFTKTKDDWETGIQVNHLGTSLLTLLLLPHLKKARVVPPTPRIVIVSSETHYFMNPKFALDSSIMEAVNNEKSSKMSERYFLTKLFNILFVHALAARLPTPSPDAPGLVVTTVNPGWCKTQLLRAKDALQAYVIVFASALLARTAEMGSRTIVWAAFAHPEAGKPLHGHYSSSCRIEEESDFALSKEGKDLSERLWTETIDVLTKVEPDLQRIIQENLLNSQQ